jgi:large subunit ribosomal protein L20
MSGVSYSQLMHGLKRADIAMDRKALADLAVNDLAAFTAVAERAKAALQ